MNANSTKGLTAIERIAGDTFANLQEQDWPSPTSADAYRWPDCVEPRGNILLSAMRVRGSDEINRKLQKQAKELSESL